MKKRISQSVGDLIDCTISTSTPTEMWQYIADHKDDIVVALEIIGDADAEPLIEAAHLALWKTCPEELEAHVAGCVQTYIEIIGCAWQNHGQEVLAVIDASLDEVGVKPTKAKKYNPVGQLPTKANPKDVAHLNKCLELN